MNRPKVISCPHCQTLISSRPYRPNCGQVITGKKVTGSKIRGKKRVGRLCCPTCQSIRLNKLWIYPEQGSGAEKEATLEVIERESYKSKKTQEDTQEWEAPGRPPGMRAPGRPPGMNAPGKAPGMKAPRM